MMDSSQCSAVTQRIKEVVLRTKKDGIPNAFAPYKQQEINLILSLVPTHGNGRWLKDVLNRTEDTQDNVVTKVARAKKKLGIFVGHEIK